jgi:hypothetical protein
VPGAKHDFQLFRENLAAVEELVAAHPGEPTHILADKGYVGDVGSGTVVLVTPRRARANQPLGGRERGRNAALSRSHVAVENYFGRLQGTFGILAHRWAFGEVLYPGMFRVCCALANFDLRPDGGFHRKLLTVRCEGLEGEQARRPRVHEEPVDDGEVAWPGDRGEIGSREEDG